MDIFISYFMKIRLKYGHVLYYFLATNIVFVLYTHQLMRMISVRTKSTLLLNKCQTRPVSGVSALRATNAFSCKIFLFPRAILLMTFSASLYFP